MEEQFYPMSSMSYVLTRPAAAGEVERVINFLLAGFFLLDIWAWTPRITGVVKERWRETLLLDRLFHSHCVVL